MSKFLHKGYLLAVGKSPKLHMCSFLFGRLYISKNNSDGANPNTVAIKFESELGLQTPSLNQKLFPLLKGVFAYCPPKVR